MGENIKKAVNREPPAEKQDQPPAQRENRPLWCDSTVDGLLDDPTYFNVCMVVTIKWDDLTGQERPNQPWLNGQPRLILLSDADAGDRPAVPGRCSLEFLKEKVIDRVRSATQRTAGCC
jgi:hypothetical protein